MNKVEQTKKQTMRFSDDEVSLIKSTFKDNQELSIAIRKVFLQKPLTAPELGMIMNLKDKKELLKVIRKTFLPTIDADAPFNQVVDLWMTLELKDKTPEIALPHIWARAMLIEYLEQQLKVLEGEREEKVKFEDFVNIKETDISLMYARLITRNTIIQHTEMQLQQFEVLANLEDKTEDQIKAENLKNSSK